MKSRAASIEKLIALLESKENLKQALETAIKKAAQPGIETLEQFYDFSNDLLTYIPTKSEINKAESQFYYIISASPDHLLKKDNEFNKWINEFVADCGNFMNTPASAKNLDDFIQDPSFSIQDYYAGPGGWLTFNQFITRRLKAGKRTIADLCNEGVIVSTTDSVYMGQWPVIDAKVITKGTNYSVIALLDGSPYQDKFREGIFTHSYLNLSDYHHFHVPVGGVIREVRKIPGNTLMDIIKQQDGSLEDEDRVDFQFTQTRGLIVIESAVGFVAVLAVGMGLVSSVTLTVDEGATLAKGDEFGHFSFGGSDMIMLFEAGKVEFTAEANKPYKYGEQIARAIG